MGSQEQNGNRVTLGSMKFIPISQIPEKAGLNTLRPPNQILIEGIKRIPAGSAWVITEDDLVELGMPSSTAVRVAVPRYAKRNLVPKHFKAIQRKFEGKITIYIANLSTRNAETPP